MHLSDVQARRLYRILDELTVYANKTRRIVAVKELFDPLTHEVTDYARTEVLPVVWDVPEIIDEFVARNPAGLAQRDLDEALRWKDNVSGYALLLDYDASGRALFELGDDVVAVAGISRAIFVIFGFFCGACAWWTLLACVINLFRRRFRPRHMLTINHVAGLIIGLLGIYTILSTFFDIFPNVGH